MTIIIHCEALEPHDHEFPDDWVFGGSDGLHWGADPRYEPSSYTYYGADIREIWTTSGPLCDEEALDMFTWVAETFTKANPTWLSVRRPGGEKVMLKVRYDKTTDELIEVTG